MYLKDDTHPKDISTPNMSTTWSAVFAESSTSFNASSSLQVATKPSTTASKSAWGYRDYRMPKVRLAGCRMLTRMISRDQLDGLCNICGVRALGEDSPGWKKATVLFTISFMALSSASDSMTRSRDSKKKPLIANVLNLVRGLTIWLFGKLGNFLVIEPPWGGIHRLGSA
jgi:hypothetical protein